MLRKCEVRPKPENTSELASLRRCVRTLLTKGTTDTLQMTYEAIYATCRSIVCVSNKGEGLYEVFKEEMERATTRMALALTNAEPEREGVDWIADFVEWCAWFEEQVVSIYSFCV